MSKCIKIIIGVIGGLVALSGLFWATMAICAHYGIDHLYDEKHI